MKQPAKFERIDEEANGQNPLDKMRDEDIRNIEDPKLRARIKHLKISIAADMKKGASLTTLRAEYLDAIVWQIRMLNRACDFIQKYDRLALVGDESAEDRLAVWMLVHVKVFRCLNYITKTVLSKATPMETPESQAAFQRKIKKSIVVPLDEDL